MSGCVAVLDASRSALSFAVFDAEADTAPLLFRGVIENLSDSPQMTVRDAGGQGMAEGVWPGAHFDHAAATRQAMKTSMHLLEDKWVAAVGHRVAHGGLAFETAVRLDSQVVATLGAFEPFAPALQQATLAPVRCILEAAPNLPQVACFDTAFHRTQPQLAQMFGLPRAFHDKGVQGYGAAGLSCEAVVAELERLAPDVAKGRVLIVSLGAGVNLCAVRGGRSIASTPGFSAADGLMAATTCGAIDAGALIHLIRSYNLDADELETLLLERSGLLGVSGVSSEFSDLRACGEPAAAEAIDLYCYRIGREIGSMAAALDGLDALVFSGSVGEADPGIRAEVCAGCHWLGVELDEGRNERNEARISDEHSTVSVWVVSGDAARTIAAHTANLLGLKPRQLMAIT